MLNWNDAEVMAFFEVALSHDDLANSYSAEVSRDGLRLLVTLFDFESAVYVSIFRDGLPDPIFTVRRERCTHAQVVGDSYNGQCFEAGSPKHPVSNMGIPPILVRGVRIHVRPQFRVELIESRYDD